MVLKESDIDFALPATGKILKFDDEPVYISSFKFDTLGS